MIENKFAKLTAINPMYAQVLEKMIDMHISKSHDYSKTNNPYSSFERAAEIAGTDVETVFNVMDGVKKARLESLFSEGKTPNNESIEDTLIDKAVYNALHAAWYLRELNSKCNPEPKLSVPTKPIPTKTIKVTG